MRMSEAQEKCICPMCPTYERCGESLAFCFYPEGKSGCIEQERGCICPTCVVQIQEGLGHTYYCTRGSEAAQAG